MAFFPITADVRSKTNQFKQGTKWNLSHSKPGYTSWIGAKQTMDKRLEDRMQKYGAVKADGTIDVTKLGVNRFMACGADGLVDPTRNVMNIGGVTMYANDKGVYTIFDKEFLDEEHKLALEQDEYTREILSYCLTSDEIAAKLLTDGDPVKLKALLDKGPVAPLEAECKAHKFIVSISNELGDVCGLPSFIQCLEGNIKSLAISKLKILVKAINPAVENEMTGYDSGKEEGGDAKEK